MIINIRVTDETGRVGQADIELAEQPHGPVSPTGAWKLAFSDDFDTLDLSKWVVQNDRDMNGVHSRTSNASVANSQLRLALSSDAGVVHGAVVSSATDWDASSSGLFLRPGQVVEALVKAPQAAGNWGGLWTSGPGWPTSGENDLYEYDDTGVSINYHGGTSVAPYTDNGAKQSMSLYAGRWVRVTLHRTEGGYSNVYYDGTLMRSINTYGHEAADAPQAIMFSLGTNTTHPTFGQAGALLVDWVRVYDPA